MKTRMTARIAALSVAGIVTTLLSPAIASPYSDFSHQVEVTHGDREVTAVYQPKTLVSYRQIGNMTPNRPSTAHCMWKAEISVERHLKAPAGNGGHVVRSLAPMKVIEGQTLGRCAMGKEQVDSAIARRSDEIREHVLAVAAEDRNALMAELSVAGASPAG